MTGSFSGEQRTNPNDGDYRRDHNMKILSKEKVKVLAEKNSWSLAQAEGYVDGETFRRRGKTPSTYVRIGIDEYSLGFRAGYYERQNPVSTVNIPGLHVTRLSLQRSKDSSEPVDVSTGSAQSR